MSTCAVLSKMWIPSLVARCTIKTYEQCRPRATFRTRGVNLGTEYSVDEVLNTDAAQDVSCSNGEQAAVRTTVSYGVSSGNRQKTLLNSACSALGGMDSAVEYATSQEVAAAGEAIIQRHLHAFEMLGK